MIKWFKDIFASPEGETSAKRVAAIALIVNGICMAWQNNPQGVIVIGTGTALLVAGAITKS